MTYVQCLYKSRPCDDRDILYGKVNIGRLCIGMWNTVKISFTGKCLQEMGRRTEYQRTIGPENAHLKPDPGVLSHHEMTLTLNTNTPLLTSQVVCICKVSGLRLQ